MESNGPSFPVKISEFGKKKEKTLRDNSTIFWTCRMSHQAATCACHEEMRTTTWKDVRCGSCHQSCKFHRTAWRGGLKAEQTHQHYLLHTYVARAKASGTGTFCSSTCKRHGDTEGQVPITSRLLDLCTLLLLECCFAPIGSYTFLVLLRSAPNSSQKPRAVIRMTNLRPISWKW